MCSSASGVAFEILFFFWSQSMQSAKDSLYVALRDRLAALDPARVVFLDGAGASRPAVIVCENEPVTAAPQLPSAFYLSWGAVAAVPASSARRPILRLEA